MYETKGYNADRLLLWRDLAYMWGSGWRLVPVRLVHSVCHTFSRKRVKHPSLGPG